MYTHINYLDLSDGVLNRVYILIGKEKKHFHEEAVLGSMIGVSIFFMIQCVKKLLK